MNRDPHAAVPVGEANGAAAGVPAKCVACSREMSSAAVCDWCHTLNPVSAPTDYFQLLGVPRRYDLDADELRRRYLQLSRHAHPDFHSGEAPEAQSLALTIASALNDAYRTLADPAARAEYLVELLGGKSSAADKSTPEGFLAEMMMLQEELAEARLEGDRAALERHAVALRRRLADKMARVGALFTEFESQVGCEGTRLECLARLRQQLNAISYVRRLVSMAERT